jgi:hypothetical protein
MTTAGTRTPRKTAASKANGEEAPSKLHQLLHKAPTTKTLPLFFEDEEGEKHEIELKFVSIGAKAYDKLAAKHPPTVEQRLEGSTFNTETFAPALIAACCVDPEMSETEAKQLWNSDTWSRGDRLSIYRAAVEVNNAGMDIPFSERG